MKHFLNWIHYCLATKSLLSWNAGLISMDDLSTEEFNYPETRKDIDINSYIQKE